MENCCQLAIFLVGILLWAVSAQAAVVEHTFRVFYKDGAPDGVSARRILTVNGKFPGPLISLRCGDLLRVKVINEIEQDDGANHGITIHWHGLFQNGSQFNDGVEYVTQCTIPVKQSMQYEFRVTQIGTFWWHAHVTYQYTEGMYGPIVIRPPLDHQDEHSSHSYKDNTRYSLKKSNHGGSSGSGTDGHGYCQRAADNPQDAEGYEAENELLFIISEWNHQPGAELASWFLSSASGGTPPLPDAGLLNGRGHYPCSFAELQDLPCDAEAQERYPHFWGTRGKVYRIRLISAAALNNFQFFIDGHQLTVIELDGNGIKRGGPESTVDFVTIGPGQRYSFLVRMGGGPVFSKSKEEEEQEPPNSGIDSFWIRARSLSFIAPDNINPYPQALIADSLGVLSLESDREVQDDLSAFPFQYRSIFSEEPESVESGSLPETTSVVDTDPTNARDVDVDLLSFIGGPAPQPTCKSKSRSKNYGHEYDHDHDDGSEEDIFEIVLLLNEATNATTNETRFSFNGVTYIPDVEDKPVLAKVIGDETETIVDTINPFFFKKGQIVQVVVNSLTPFPHPLHLHGHAFWVLGTGAAGAGTYKGSAQKLNYDGIVRDTHCVNALSWVVLRFVADNPGVWLFHCHIQWHAIAGLSAAFIEGAEELQHQKIPQEFNRVCQLNGI